MQPDADTVGLSAIFESLSEGDRDALALCFRGRGYGPGEIVFREGDPGDSLYLVGQGTLVAVSRAGGSVREIGRYARGQVIGETSILVPAPRPCTLTAVGPAVVYELGAADLDVLRAGAPSAARALAAAGIKALIQRLHQLEARVDQALDRAGSP